MLSATWLFWLYVSTPIASITQWSSAERSTLATTLQPLKASLASLQAIDNRIQPLITPMPPEDPTQVRLEVHLKRRQVVLFQGKVEIRRYAIAIGQTGWETPKGHFQVLDMREKPDWIHPLTNQLVPNADVKNPLGRYWIGFWTDGTNWVGFHGTPHPSSVGQALSHGCLRMHDADIDELYYQVSTGTPVTVKQ